MVIADADGTDVPLIVIGCEGCARPDLNDVFLEEQAAGNRPELDDSRVGIAQISRPSLSSRKFEANIDTRCAAPGDGVRKDDRCAKEDVWVASALDAAAPVRDIESYGPGDWLVDGYFNRGLTLRRQLASADSRLFGEWRQRSGLFGRREENVLSLRRLEEPSERSTQRRLRRWPMV